MATGLVRDLRHVATSDLKEEGDALYLLGRTAPEMGGSLWARRKGEDGLRVPATDPSALRRLGDALVAAIERDWVRAAHDVSDGGLAVTLAEMAFGGRLGVDVDLIASGAAGPGTALAAEGASRFAVEVRSADRTRFERALRGLPCRPGWAG